MRFNGLDLNLLVALDAILTEKNVTRAAGKVFLSQSAMSGALAKLREHFGDELIHRAGRSMVLTPFGSKLVQPVEDLMLHAKSVLGRRPQFDPRTSDRSFRIGASDFVIGAFFPEVVRHVALTAPSVTLDVYDITARDAFADLERGLADFLIVSASRCSPTHPSTTLFEDKWSVIGDRKYHSARTAIPKADFASAHHVAVKFGGGEREGIVERTLSEFQLSRHVAVWVSNYEVIPEMILGTDRIATVPMLLASQLAGLTIMAPPVDFPPIRELLQWAHYQNEDAGIQWMRQTLVQAFASRTR